MIAGGNGGSIINISSQMGHVGGVDRTVYAASKHAIEGMTKSMAIEWGLHGIRVNTICPGFVQGNWLREGMGAERYDATLSHLEKTTPLRKAGTPEEMAEAAVWFLEGAGHITGEVLIVDSGLHLGAAPMIAR